MRLPAQLHFSQLQRRNSRTRYPLAFRSVGELEAAIYDYLAKNNASPKPFAWTKTADAILAKNARARAALEAVKIGNQTLESEH